MTESKQATAGDKRVREALTSIGAHARTTNLVRAEQLDDALTQLETGGLDGAQREAAVRSAHQLAGSAGTFGLGAASGLASWFERFFGRAENAASSELSEARHQLSQLRISLEESPDLG